MTVLTLLKSSEGWRVMTATFSVIDVAGSNVALQVAVN
jgi:hypothetical protein